MIHFGDLRSVLKSAPSPQGWARIVAILDQAPADEVRELIPYLRGHLEAWPASMLQAPHDWIWRATSGEVVHQLRLIKALDASGLSPHQLIKLIANYRLDALRILSIEDAAKAQELDLWLEAVSGLKLSALSLGKHLSDNALMCLLAHPISSGLSALSISQHALTAQGFALLGSAPSLRGLAQLSLRDGELDQAQADALAQASALTSLRALSLASTTFDQGALSALIERGELLAQVHALELSQLRFSSWSAPVELAGRPLPTLRSLDLSGLRFDQHYSANGRPLLKLVGESMPALKQLRLSHVQGFPDPLVLAINSSSRHRLSWGHFPSLESLDLRENALSQRALRHLGRSFEGLIELRLDLSLIGPVGAQLLAESANLPKHITAHWAMVSQGFRGSNR